MARRGRPRKRVGIPRKYVVLFFLLCIAALIVFAGYRSAVKIPRIVLFKVDTIDAGPEVGSDIAADVGHVAEGESIFSLDIHKIREEVMDDHPEVRELTITKKFPSTLRLEAEGRGPFFQLKQEAYYIVGRDYTVIDKSLHPREGLVVVEAGSVSGDVERGGRLDDERIDKACALIDILSEYEEFPPEIVLADEPESFSFITGGKKIILGKDGFRTKLDRLRSLSRERFNDGFSGVKYIDLRYSKVYIGK